MKRSRAWLLVAAALTAPVIACAQGGTATDSGSGSATGGGIQAGALRLFPSLGLSFGYESNVSFASHDETDSFTTRLSPAIHANAGDASNHFSVDLASNLAWYTQSSTDNYSDVNLRATWLYNPVLRHALALDGGINWSHDPRGTGAREGDLAFLDLDPDRYRKSDLGARYQFGAPGARARLEVDGRVINRTYTNNRDFTRFRDDRQTEVDGAFFWRIAPKTSAEVRVEHNNINYDVASLDSTEQHYFVGVEFDPTAKLSGALLVGQLKKQFDDPSRSDTSGASWRVGLKYQLRTYSTLNLTTARETDETNGTGDYILRRDVTLGWNHNWTDRISTAIDTGYAKEDHRPTVREDKTSFVGFSADYLFRPWLRAGASYRTFNRSSDIDQFEYNRDLILFSLEASL